MDRITVIGFVPGVTPEELHQAFLDPETHSNMTGAPATAKGDSFTAWDGYIKGKTLSEGPPIVQLWSTSDFPKGAEPSRLEIHFKAEDDGTEVRFEQRNIPEGQGANYEQGWMDFYILPMQEWFGQVSD